MKTQIYPPVETPKTGIGIFGVIALGIAAVLIIIYVKNKFDNGETEKE